MRRLLIVNSALEVLAEHGSRGMTHRAVDTKAGIAAGSTSYYYRSRGALLLACVERLIQIDREQLAHAAPLLIVTSSDGLADSVTKILWAWLTQDRVRHLARFELFMEALRRPELADVLYRGADEMQGGIAQIIGALGAPEPERQAHWLTTCLDGFLFDAIAGARSNQPYTFEMVSATARDLVRGLLPFTDVPYQRPDEIVAEA